MSAVYLLSETQMSRIEPYFPRSRGAPRVDDRRVVSGIVYVASYTTGSTAATLASVRHKP